MSSRLPAVRSVGPFLEPIALLDDRRRRFLRLGSEDDRVLRIVGLELLGEIGRRQLFGRFGCRRCMELLHLTDVSILGLRSGLEALEFAQVELLDEVCGRQTRDSLDRPF